MVHFARRSRGVPDAQRTESELVRISESEPAAVSAARAPLEEPVRPAARSRAAAAAGRAVPGKAQVARPSSSSTAGTSTQRMTTASRRTALASPSPKSAIVRSPERMKLAKTTTITAAAAVTTRPVRVKPRRTASLFELPWTHASWMRETRKTS